MQSLIRAVREIWFYPHLEKYFSISNPNYMLEIYFSYCKLKQVLRDYLETIDSTNIFKGMRFQHGRAVSHNLWNFTDTRDESRYV